MYNKLLEYEVTNNLDKDDFIYPNKVRNITTIKNNNWL